MYAISMTAKSRLSVTIDADLIEAGQAAVAAGEAESVSACWGMHRCRTGEPRGSRAGKA